MNSHPTPGPWAVGYSTPDDFSAESALSVLPGDAVDGQPVRPICKLSPTSTEDEEDRANARLIAAAPDLLEALKDLIAAKDEAENDPCYLLNKGLHINKINTAFDLARGFVRNAIGQ